MRALKKSGNNFAQILISSANNVILHDLNRLRLASGLSSMNGTLTLTFKVLGYRIISQEYPLSTARSDAQCTSTGPDTRDRCLYIDGKSALPWTGFNRQCNLLPEIGRQSLTAHEFSISKTYVLRSLRALGLALTALREAVETGNPSTTETFHTSLTFGGRP